MAGGSRVEKPKNAAFFGEGAEEEEEAAVFHFCVLSFYSLHFATITSCLLEIRKGSHAWVNYLCHQTIMLKP